MARSSVAKKTFTGTFMIGFYVLLVSLTFAVLKRTRQYDCELTLVPASFDVLPGWRQSDPLPALRALQHSCDRMLRHPHTMTIGGNTPMVLTPADWQPACQALSVVEQQDPSSIWQYFERYYTPFLVSAKGHSEGLFTGYYLPRLKGSVTPDPHFPYPVYGLPDDLVSVNPHEFERQHAVQRWVGRLDHGRLVPYPEREAIRQGALQSHAKILLWVDDLVDLFFMEIQGSGKVVFANGHQQLLGYAGQNGKPYTSLGKVLRDDGLLRPGQVSMPMIRRALASHRSQRENWLNKNKSYVFFRPLSGTQPLGAQAVTLTPGGSLAVDRRYIPLGIPLWLSTTTDDPWFTAKHLFARSVVQCLVGELPDLFKQPMLQQLMVAQDTGGAIQGAVRGDVYWGEDDMAAELAGHMQARGRYWLLLPSRSAHVGYRTY